MKFWPVFVALFFLVAPRCEAGVLVRFHMNADLGTIDAELFEQDKPVTVSNFLAYVKSGAWHDNIMHRWVQDFVIQGGSYKVPHDPNLMTPLATNPAPITAFGNIPFEENIGHFYSNVYGTMAMARVGTDTNSASESWFFNVKDNINLDTQDGGYTVFGRTLRGTNTLNRFKAPSGSTNIYFLSDQSTPVYSTDGRTGFWLNVDITVLTAQIALVRGAPQISWTSVEGRPNIVEYTTTVPAVWHALQTVAGTGATMAVTDSSTDPARQYRVRIDYTN